MLPLLLLPISLSLAPAPAARVDPGETALSVQTEVVRELSAAAQNGQQRIDQLSSGIDQLADATSAGAELSSQLNELARAIDDSELRLAELRAQARDPAGASAEVYARQLADAEQAEFADRERLNRQADDLRTRQAQLDQDSATVRWMLGTNIPSEALDELQSKVNQDTTDLAQLQDQQRNDALASSIAAAERRNQLEQKQRGDALAASQELARAANEELARGQRLQRQYAALQKQLSDRENQRDADLERLRAENLKRDRMTAELQRQRELLARIAHS